VRELYSESNVEKERQSSSSISHNGSKVEDEEEEEDDDDDDDVLMVAEVLSSVLVSASLLLFVSIPILFRNEDKNERIDSFLLCFFLDVCSRFLGSDLEEENENVDRRSACSLAETLPFFLSGKLLVLL
jgi:hypothetical protein